MLAGLSVLQCPLLATLGTDAPAFTKGQGFV